LVAGFLQVRQTRSGAWGRVGTRRVHACVVALVVSVLSSSAGAFEREWHLGAGLGLAAAPGYSFGPAASLYGAYGLSDAFDARLELSTSIQDRLDAANAFFSFKAALAYKLDVGRWIPWIGPSAGGLATGQQKWPFDALQPTVGAIAGLDYVWTRHFGVGLCLSGDYGFDQAAVYGAGYLRAEYHWGW
jgi:hypothetical protein